MGLKGRPVVVVVFGCPGAGKTTVASATARWLGVPLMARMGVPHLTQDEYKNGLGLSTARATDAGALSLDPGFHVAGGPFSVLAQNVVVEVTRVLVSLTVSFVVETSVLSAELLDAARTGDARVLGVHVVARQEIIAERLRARARGGGRTAQQLAARFERSELDPAVFAPTAQASLQLEGILELDTSDSHTPKMEPVEKALLAMLR